MNKYIAGLVFSLLFFCSSLFADITQISLYDDGTEVSCSFCFDFSSEHVARGQRDSGWRQQQAQNAGVTWACFRFRATGRRSFLAWTRSRGSFSLAEIARKFPSCKAKSLESQRPCHARNHLFSLPCSAAVSLGSYRKRVPHRWREYNFSARQARRKSPS